MAIGWCRVSHGRGVGNEQKTIDYAHSPTSTNPAFISPPAKIPWYLRLGLWVAQRISGEDLLPARLLAWYPKAAVSSAVLEGLIAHQDGQLDERILKLVRMAVSFTAGCPFAST